MSPLDRSFAKIDRAAQAAIFAVAGVGLANAGAPVAATISLSVGAMMIVMGAFCVVVALGLLISVAFIGMGTITPQSSEDSWRGTAPSSFVDEPTVAHETEPCHCMNCLNKRTW